MFNKHKFDIEMEKLQQEQVTMLYDYLAGFIKNNCNASEMPLFDDNIKKAKRSSPQWRSRSVAETLRKS